jgi:hypothetical protein
LRRECVFWRATGPSSYTNQIAVIFMLFAALGGAREATRAFHPRPANATGSAGIGGVRFGWHCLLWLDFGSYPFTQMTTPVVQALVALSAVGGVQFGLATGAGLGLARSLEPWRGALARITPLPATVVERYANGATGASFRLGGIVLAALVLSADVYCALRRY